MQNNHNKVTFNHLLSEIKKKPKKTILLIFPENSDILETVKNCIEFCDFILIGNIENIKQISKQISLDISQIKTINNPNEKEAINTAIDLVLSKQGDIIMKGCVTTKNILSECFKRKTEIIKPNSLVTSVSVFELDSYPKYLCLSDPTVLLRPTLQQKAEIIKYMRDVCLSLGVSCPKISVLSAIEEVNPKMIETVEADQLRKMNEDGFIENCVVDGPLSLDLSVDPDAAHLKKTEGRKIIGDADALLFPDIHSANFVYKIFTHLMHAKCANIVVGTTVPIIITSRSDSSENKKNSVILSCYYSEYINSNY